MTELHPAPDAPLLAFDGIGFERAGRPILAGVTLDLAVGELVALVGPNGAGKTTLLRIAARLLAPSRGQVRLAGTPLDGHSRRELAQRIAVVPQDTQVAFPFRAGEVVLMGRAPHAAGFGLDAPADVEIARAALARVGIEALADRSMLELSGGERQLVLVARALAQEPRLLLLDEPTAHLDLHHRLRVLDEVAAFCAAGGAALVISHDLTLAAATSRRIAVLDRGRLVAQGPAREVLQPAVLRPVFGVDTELLEAADGALALLARPLPSPRDPA